MLMEQWLPQPNIQMHTELDPKMQQCMIISNKHSKMQKWIPKSKNPKMPNT